MLTLSGTVYNLCVHYLKNINKEVLHCYLEGKFTVSLKHCSSARGKRRRKWHRVRVTGETVANLWVQPSHSPSETHNPNSHNRKFLFTVVFVLLWFTHTFLFGGIRRAILGRRHTPQTRKKRIAFKRYKKEEIEVRTYVYSNSLSSVNYTPPQIVLSNTTQME